MAFVYRNGVEIGRASATLPEGEHIEIQIFSALDKTDADGHRKSLAVGLLGGGKKVDVPELARRSSIPAGFLQKAREVVTAGTTLILSDLAVSPTQSKPGFNILNASVAPSGTGTSSLSSLRSPLYRDPGMGGSITNRIRLDRLQLPALKLILKKNILPCTRLGRLIEPSEIAEAICFLISNSEVSGQLWADAGWHPPFLNSKSPPVK